MRRLYPKAPIPAVAAVIFQGDQVLLVERAKEPSKGQWTLPGGVIEVGEGHIAALKREIKEETGLGIEVKSLVEVIDKIVLDSKGQVKYHYLILDYWAEPECGMLRPASDALSTRWIDIDWVKDINLAQDTIDVICKARAMRKGGNDTYLIR